MAKLTGVKEFLLNMVLPSFLEFGSQVSKAALQEAFDEDENGKTLITAALIAVYPVIDVYLERYVLKTKTKIDDKSVAELKETLEEFAATNGIDLPNLDAGQPGD